jgi:hypothetical protein
VYIGRFLGICACVGSTVLAVGCGAEHVTASSIKPPNLAAAVRNTQGQTARIAATISTQSQGMTLSFTETGLFDFAHSRGMITTQSPMGVTEIFIPPTTYIKDPDDTSDGGTLPDGKTWMAMPDSATSASALLGVGGGGDPAGLLASLTAMSSGVTRIGTTTIRGVPVTGFAFKVDPAKAAAQVPSADRASLEALDKLFGAAEIPVDVWVDGHHLVRQEKLTLAVPGGTGAPGGTHLVITTDFYDFGVPVRVSAPPASQVATEESLAGGSSAGSGSGSANASPPPTSGTLTPDQAASAEQAVAAFWAALGSNNSAAVAETVLPAQRSCVQSELGSGSPTITVSGLRITSAQPAGNSSATVRFTVTAKASLGGQTIPVFPQAPGSAQWLVTTEVAGRWYVNIEDSTALVFAGACG